MHNVGDEKIVEIVERHSEENSLGPLFDCEYDYLNFSNMFFGGRGFHNGIFHQIVYRFVKIHIHEEILY